MGRFRVRFRLLGRWVALLDVVWRDSAHRLALGKTPTYLNFEAGAGDR